MSVSRATPQRRDRRRTAGAHGVVAHGDEDPPPLPGRHAHPERCLTPGCPAFTSRIFAGQGANIPGMYLRCTSLARGLLACSKASPGPARQQRSPGFARVPTRRYPLIHVCWSQARKHARRHGGCIAGMGVSWPVRAVVPPCGRDNGTGPGLGVLGCPARVSPVLASLPAVGVVASRSPSTARSVTRYTSDVPQADSLVPRLATAAVTASEPA